MKSNEKYAFFLDIDGTVFKHGEICEKNREAIDAVRKAGHFVLLNTGRSYGIIPEPVLELPLDGVVSSLGSSVKIGNEYVLCDKMEITEVAELLDLFTEKGYGVIFEGENNVWKSTSAEREGCPSVKDSKELLEKYGDEIISKIFIPGVLDEKLQAELSEKYMFFQHKNYAEFTTQGHTKASGMFLAAEYLGVPHERCVAMGDGINDVDMLKNAGISVAMGDGDDVIKSFCDIVTCPAADGGVAEAMMKITKLGAFAE